MDPKELAKQMEAMGGTLEGIDKGTKKSLEEIEKLDGAVAVMTEKQEKADGRLASIDEFISTSKSREDAAVLKMDEIDTILEGQDEQMTGLRKLLDHDLGKSGADDYLETLGRWIKGIYHHKRDGKVPEELTITGYDFEARGKSATTQSDGNAGYLIPDMLSPELIRAESVYGNFLPLIRQITMAPGSTLKVNNQITRAVASWRCAECTDIAESEILLGQQELSPCLLGGITPVGQELFQYPGARFAEIVGEDMVLSIVEKKESAMLQGDDGVGGAAAPPADGILIDSNVNDIAAGLPLAATLGDYLDFIQAGVENYPYLMKTGILFLPIGRHFKLISELVNKSASSPAWDAMKPGSPSSPLGFPAIPHQEMVIGATEWAAFLKASDIMAATSGSIIVDINPWGTGWSSNCLSIKTYTYFDWILTNADKMSKGDFATS